MGRVLGPHTHTTHAQETLATGPGRRIRRAVGGAKAPDTRRPSQQCEVTRPQATFCRQPRALQRVHNPKG